MKEKEILKNIVKHAKENSVKDQIEAGIDIWFVVIHQDIFKVDDSFEDMCFIFSMMDLLEENLAKEKLRKKLEKKLEKYYITKH